MLPRPEVIRSLWLVLAVASLSGCALRTDRLRWRVDRADLVALQAVGPTGGAIARYDLAHPRDVLEAGGGPRTELAPFRSGSVLARRNPDGSIDLQLWNGTWRLVDANGTVTALRDEAHELPAAGTAWAFLASPPSGLGARTPWQLRLATPRDNVRDARIVVRRDRESGGIFLVAGGILTVFGAGSMTLASRAPGSPAIPATFGAIGLTAAALSIGWGLYALLLHEHDEVITAPVTY